MRGKTLLCLFVVMMCSRLSLGQADDPAKKLGAFLGKWKSEGIFADGGKVTADLDCRWSPQGSYMVCEQAIKMAGGNSRQLTVYSYSAKDGNYSFTTISNPGAKPSSGTVQINGYAWIYSSSFEANGKTTQIRTTNLFPQPSLETFKVESSDDGGSTWKSILEGTAHKTGQ
jgi:hypothetical protein